jgi:hypothetical protein
MTRLHQFYSSLALSAIIATTPALVAAQADKKKEKGHAAAEDIMDHRTMAEAHRKAAECLEAGKPEKDCRAQLAKDCKGVGIGKHCGMKDRHKH